MKMLKRSIISSRCVSRVMTLLNGKNSWVIARGKRATISKQFGLVRYKCTRSGLLADLAYIRPENFRKTKPFHPQFLINLLTTQPQRIVTCLLCTTSMHLPHLSRHLSYS